MAAKPPRNAKPRELRLSSGIKLVAAEKFEQNFAESNFFFFACHHMRHIRHGDADRISQPLLKRLGRSGPGDNVFTGMNDQRWRFDITQVRADIVPTACLHKAQVRLDASLERSPYTATTE